MKAEVVLVVDFGTSNVHVNAVSLENGDILHSASKKYPLLGAEEGYAEIESALLWENSEACVEKVVSVLQDSAAIKAIAFSFFGDNLIPVDKDGNALYNCILAFDRRGAEEADFINGALGDGTLIELTGAKYQGFMTGAKILWLKKNLPQVFEKTAYFDTQQQYVFRKLGLPGLNDYTMACRKSLFDIRKRCWAQPLLELIGITQQQLGQAIPSGGVVGRISAYGRVGFGCEIPVIAGAHDCDVGMIGLGVSHDALPLIADIGGTYDHLGFIATGFRNVQNDYPGGLLMSYCGPMANTSSCIGAFPTSGAVLEWFMREIVGDTSAEAFSRMWSQAVFDGTESIAADPAFASERGGAINGLTLTKTRVDIFEAIIESLTFETRRILDACRSTKGGAVREVRIGGGAANSADWIQLRADIMGVPFVRMKNIEVSSLGAAILAAVTIGSYADADAAIARMVRVRDVFEPRRAVYERYARRYAAYIGKA